MPISSNEPGRSTDIQESLFKAIDSLTQDRLARYPMDLTITAIVLRCSNTLTGEYIVSYQGGNLTAYSEPEKTYNKNTSVYVLVPEGNFSKKKIILDSASTIGEESNFTFVGSLVNDYNPQGRNVIFPKEGVTTFGLHSYRKDDYNLIYDYDDSEHSQVDIYIDEFQNYLSDSEAIMIEAEFMTNLPNEHRNTKTGIYGLDFKLAFYNRSTSEELYKTYSYVIDTNNMTGNPYAFISWSMQYAIYPIDIKNFSHIQSIVFYSSSFEDEDNLIKDEEYGADIWCQNLEIFSLKKIDATNGDYKLKVATPAGATFTRADGNSSLPVIAEMYYQNQVVDGCMFYWFREDARVTTASPEYKMYGGPGWLSLESTKGTENHIVVYERENKAYKNRYLCVGVYKEEIILKSEFVIYNNTSKKRIEIDSNLGIKFSFDRGAPTLTCLLDGLSENFEAGEDYPAHRPDSWFSFVWSKLDPYGQGQIFDRTYEELEAAYQAALANDEGYLVLSSLKNQMQMLEGVTFDRNKLTYPVHSIDSTASFRCSVYVKDSEDGESYFIGSADILLQNDGTATPEDYSIIIENGDQVFQYSESGVTPKSERYRDPQKILDLYCHFFDPAGLEIDAKTYDVKWQVPIDSTMIKVPTNLHINPSNNRPEWFIEEIYHMDIVDSFDYQALNNQVTCIVTYDGREYYKDTRFSFVKIGDNGTNGTDIVVKVSPISDKDMLDQDLLTLFLDRNNKPEWNTGQTISEKVLDFDVYQREQRLLPESVTWSIAGGTSSVFQISNPSGDKGTDGTSISYSPNEKGKRYQIIKGQTTLEIPMQTGNLTEEEAGGDVARKLSANRTTYYAYYAVPIIKTSQGRKYPLHVDSTYTLKQIIYNSEGRNPLYNKNQGVKLRYAGPGGSSKRATFEALGGINESATGSQNTAAFKLMRNRDDAKNNEGVSDVITATFDENGECMIYVLPDDVYSGLYTNNIVYGRIYSGSTLEAEVWVPIHMQLNTVELASLNAWDGNHVDINEDENYVLAPQVGAGEKDKDNRFTGILMGKHQKYDEKKARIGLLGYSHGQQSIWMDAETGNTILGLTDYDSKEEGVDVGREGAAADYSEGRIELIPRGTSSIASWKINSEALYNVVDGVLESGPYKGDLIPKGSNHHIPSDKPGILLNAHNEKRKEGTTATYLSIKGAPIESAKNGGELQDSANVIAHPGDSYEIELDPNKMSAFTVFIHSDKWTDSKGDWKRRKLVGIDGRGRFYANALLNEVPPGSGQSGSGNIETAVDLGYVGAFGWTAADYKFIGHSVDFGSTGSTTLFKAFTDADFSRSTTLYISGATGSSSGSNNEWERPLSLHGEDFSVYIHDGKTHERSLDETSRQTARYIKINKDQAAIQLDPPRDGDAANEQEKKPANTSARNFFINGGTTPSELHVGPLIRTITGNYLNYISENEDTTVKGTTLKNHEQDFIRNIGKEDSGKANATYFTSGTHTETVKDEVLKKFGANEQVFIKKEFLLKTKSSNAENKEGTTAEDKDGFEIDTLTENFKMKVGSSDEESSIWFIVKDPGFRSIFKDNHGLTIATSGVEYNDIIDPSQGDAVDGDSMAGISLLSANNGAINLKAGSETHLEADSSGTVFLKLTPQSMQEGNWHLSSPLHGAIYTGQETPDGLLDNIAPQKYVITATMGMASPFFLADQPSDEDYEKLGYGFGGYGFIAAKTGICAQKDITTTEGTLLALKGDLKCAGGVYCGWGDEEVLKEHPGDIHTDNGRITSNKGDIGTREGSVFTNKGDILTDEGNINTKNGFIQTENGNIITATGHVQAQTDMFIQDLSNDSGPFLPGVDKRSIKEWLFWLRQCVADRADEINKLDERLKALDKRLSIVEGDYVPKGTYNTHTHKFSATVKDTAYGNVSIDRGTAIIPRYHAINGAMTCFDPEGHTITINQAIPQSAITVSSIPVSGYASIDYTATASGTSSTPSPQA